MCRNIRTLYNFEPPASSDEVHAAALLVALEAQVSEHVAAQRLIDSVHLDVDAGSARRQGESGAERRNEKRRTEHRDSPVPRASPGIDGALRHLDAGILEPRERTCSALFA